MSIGIISTGSYLPKEEITNTDIAPRVGVDADWIERKTKIRSRRFAADHEATSDLAAHAGRAALEQAGLDAADIGHIIVSTSTPDSPQPPTACRVQALLGAAHAAAHDVNAVCSGFVYAFDIASALVHAGRCDHVLVIAADLYSRSLDFSDRRTAVLLGDGAGAAVVGRVDDGYGIVSTRCATHGDQQDLIRVEAGGSRLPASHATVDAGEHWFRMEGRKVRDFVLGNIPRQLHQLVTDAGAAPSDIAHLVPHQPNGVLLDELAAATGFAGARTHRTLDRFGNVGSASVPVTLDEAHRNGQLHDGELVVLSAFGGGMATGHCLLRWQDRSGLAR